MLRVACRGLIILLLALIGDAAPAADVQPIGRDRLVTMIKAELGDAYRLGNDDNYLAAHQAIENYFSTADLKQREQIVTSLQQSGIDPNALGRLTRLRSDWPALAPGSVTEVEDHVGPISVHYFLGAPDKYDRTSSWPIEMKLAEANAFAGNPKPSADDLRRMYTGWINEELSRHRSALILMPVLNLQTSWGPSYAGMNAAMGALQHAMSRANFDPTKVYLIGHGGSANAVWNLASLNPTFFTAINPLAGGALEDWQRFRLTNLHNLLVIQWHDAEDKVIKPDASRNLATILRRLKIEDDFTETQNIGHDPTAAIVDQCDNKLFARQRELYPKRIELASDRPETQFNRIDWLQIYQPTSGGEEKHIFFKRVPGRMTLMSNPWSASAFIEGNRIEITTDNVALLRIYLNDLMVDLHEPVTVVVNKQVRFQGIVAMNIKQMLSDQLFLGRGWRYFSGVIDVDLTAKPTTATTSPLK